MLLVDVLNLHSRIVICFAVVEPPKPLHVRDKRRCIP